MMAVSGSKQRTPRNSLGTLEQGISARNTTRLEDLNSLFERPGRARS